MGGDGNRIMRMDLRLEKLGFCNMVIWAMPQRCLLISLRRIQKVDCLGKGGGKTQTFELCSALQSS